MSNHSQQTMSWSPLCHIVHNRWVSRVWQWWWNTNKLHETKHPAKGERKNKERGPKSEPTWAKPKRGHKGANEQIMFNLAIVLRVAQICLTVSGPGLWSSRRPNVAWGASHIWSSRVGVVKAIWQKEVPHQRSLGSSIVGHFWHLEVEIVLEMRWVVKKWRLIFIIKEFRSS